MFIAPVLSADCPETRLATRLSFAVAGFGMACWAPLVPFVKARLGVDDGVLGLLLLCIGIGSIVAMMITGVVIARYGTRACILFGGFGLALLLPVLTQIGDVMVMGAALALFGAVVGTLDVAMNVHAVEVDQAAPRPLLSGFHALYSVGGFAGAAMMTVLLWARPDVLAATLIGSALMLAGMVIAAPRLLRGGQAGDGPLFVMPRGVVLVLSGITCAVFLIEGAMLDWSALLVTSSGLMAAEQGGVGYMLFSVAMTIGRFAGDRVTARCGDRAVLVWGGVLTLAGLAVLLLAPQAWLALSGFLLIGLGASNIVPVLFRLAGAQTVMPPALAVAAVSTAGYAGILAGPAAIGFIADIVGLKQAFWLLAVLVCTVPLAAPLITARRR